MNDKNILIVTTMACLIVSVVMTAFGSDFRWVAWILTSIFGVCFVVQTFDDAEQRERSCRMYQGRL